MQREASVQKFSKRPSIGIIYTVTAENHLAVEDFFLRDLDLGPISWVTIQMQNFVTQEMGEAYSELLRDEFDLSRERYWRAMLRSPNSFGWPWTISVT